MGPGLWEEPEARAVVSAPYRLACGSSPGDAGVEIRLAPSPQTRRLEQQDFVLSRFWKSDLKALGGSALLKSAGEGSSWLPLGLATPRPLWLAAGEDAGGTCTQAWGGSDGGTSECVRPTADKTLPGVCLPLG